MNVELINTGSELMLGFVLNSHQQWLCREMANLGYVVSRQVAISDTAEAIQDAVREGLGRADLIITTGGLGPTADDVTRDLIAQLLGTSLLFEPEVMERIKHFFGKRNRPIPPRAEVQAQVPKGSIVLHNDFGTAPGLAVKVQNNPFRPDGKQTWLIMLPGPPRELRPMFTNQVVPLLKKELPLPEAFVCRVFRTTGLGESWVEDRVAKPLQALVDQGMDLGYCARVGEVDVRVVTHGPSAVAMADQAEAIIRQTIGGYIYGLHPAQLEQTVVQNLAAAKKTLALAESCTGGYIANRITNVPGASEVLLSGVVTYSNDSKMDFLGVKKETLEKFGAVSKETATEMAEGIRQRTKADFAISVTGIAGPGGGTAEKPVGTVFVALATATRTLAVKFLNTFDRETFKYVTSQQALEMVRRELNGLEAP